MHFHIFLYFLKINKMIKFETQILQFFFFIIFFNFISICDGLIWEWDFKNFVEFMGRFLIFENWIMKKWKCKFRNFPQHCEHRIIVFSLESVQVGVMVPLQLKFHLLTTMTWFVLDRFRTEVEILCCILWIRFFPVFVLRV